MLRLATHAMGTRFELVLCSDAAGGNDDTHLRAAGEAAIEVIEECDRRLSLFRRDSLLAYVNRNAASEPVALDADTLELFEVCARVHELSHGAFDVTVAPRMRALGFHDRSSATGFAHGSCETTGIGAIVLDERLRTISFAREGMAVDLGAIGKGHALRLAARTLREAGVERAILHGGTSSVVAIGAPPGMSSWRVELEGGARAPVADLRDGALSVSAQHGRRLENGAGHILDPRTGQSATTNDIVAVFHEDARFAEAWSTALLVLGDSPEGFDACGLDVAVGRGRRFDRAWKFSRPRSSSRFTRELQSVTAS